MKYRLQSGPAVGVPGGSRPAPQGSEEDREEDSPIYSWQGKGWGPWRKNEQTQELNETIPQLRHHLCFPFFFFLFVFKTI